MHPQLKIFIENAVVPALLEQFLREHQQEWPREPSSPEMLRAPAGPRRAVHTERTETA